MTQLPFKDGKKPKVASPFGVRIHPLTHVKSHHNGVDFAVPVGTQLVAADAGKVIESRLSTAPGGGYGNYITIQHSGYRTRVAHLSKRTVKVGQKVEKGENIGLSGNTGASTGPHVHFEVIKDDVFLDPFKFIEEHNAKATAKLSSVSKPATGTTKTTS